MIKKEGLEVHCFLNDMDPNKISSIKEIIKSNGLESFVIEYYSEDANTCFKKILQKIPKNEWSIFFLDPTNYKDLKWETIKQIAEHAYQLKDFIRRPELIIHLSVYTMGQDFKHPQKHQEITDSLGNAIWKDKIIKLKKIRGESTPIFSAFFETYKEGLISLGYLISDQRVVITSTECDSPLYYIIFAEVNPKVHNKIMNNMIKRLASLQEEWQKENKREVKKSKTKKLGCANIRDYLSN